jgi:hypothetical protein
MSPWISRAVQVWSGAEAGPAVADRYLNLLDRTSLRWWTCVADLADMCRASTVGAHAPACASMRYVAEFALSMIKAAPLRGAAGRH